MKILYTIILSLFTVLAFAKPLTIVTTSGPGSLSDTAARYFAPLIEKELNRPVVIQNISGANGLVGLSVYSKMPANGDYILIGGTQIAFNAKTQKSLDFNPINDFYPLYGLSYAPQHILVPSNSKIYTFEDLVYFSKSKDGLMGGVSHPSTEMSIRLLDKSADINSTIVNYKQASQLLIDLSESRLDYTISAIGNAASSAYLSSGKLRSIVSLKSLDIEEFSWTAWFIHTSAPEDTKKYLELTLRKVMTSEDSKKFNQTVLNMNSSEIKKIVKREYEIIPTRLN